MESDVGQCRESVCVQDTIGTLSCSMLVNSSSEMSPSPAEVLGLNGAFVMTV